MEEHPAASLGLALVPSPRPSPPPSLPGRRRGPVRELPLIPLQILTLNMLLSCLHRLVSHLSKTFFVDNFVIA